MASLKFPWEACFRCFVSRRHLMMFDLKVKFPEISQVAVVVRDLNKIIENYWKMFGFGPWSIYTFAPPALTEMMVHGKPTNYSMRFAETNVGGVIIEVLEPLEGPSIYKE